MIYSVYIFVCVEISVVFNCSYFVTDTYNFKGALQIK